MMPTHKIYFIYHFTFIPHGLIRTHKWPAPNVSGLIAQLVRASHRNREVTGYNPVEVLNFSGPQHYCEDHSLLNFNTVVGSGPFDISGESSTLLSVLSWLLHRWHLVPKAPWCAQLHVVQEERLSYFPCRSCWVPITLGLLFHLLVCYLLPVLWPLSALYILVAFWHRSAEGRYFISDKDGLCHLLRSFFSDTSSASPCNPAVQADLLSNVSVKLSPVQTILSHGKCFAAFKGMTYGTNPWMWWPSHGI